MDKDKNYSGYKIGKYTYGNPKIEKWKIVANYRTVFLHFCVVSHATPCSKERSIFEFNRPDMQIAIGYRKTLKMTISAYAYIIPDFK